MADRNLNQIFKDWSKRHATPFGTVSLNIKIEDRLEALFELAQELIENGFSRDDFKSILHSIAQVCIPQNRKVKVGFAIHVAKDIFRVLEETFASEEDKADLEAIIIMVCRLARVTPPKKKIKMSEEQKAEYIERLVQNVDVTYSQVLEETKQKADINKDSEPQETYSEDDGEGEDPFLIAERYSSLKPLPGTEHYEFIEIDTELEEFLRNGARDTGDDSE